MRIAFWKIIVVAIVKNRTVHVMVATNNKFCIKITVISQKSRIKMIRLFLSKPQVWHIITHQRVSHRPQAVFAFAMMIYTPLA